MVDSIRTGKVATVTKARAADKEKRRKSKKSTEERDKKDTVPDEMRQPLGGRIDERC